MNFDFSWMNSPEWLQYIQSVMGGGAAGFGNRQTYTPGGNLYTGPFGNDNRVPFRTVDATWEGGNQPAYNRGLNASSAQLYDHFRSKPGKNAHDFGLPYAGATQSFEQFAQRPVPVIPQQPEIEVQPPNPNTNTSGTSSGAGFRGSNQLSSIFRFMR